MSDKSGSVSSSGEVDTAELALFLRTVDWDKYVEDEEIAKLGGEIRTLVKEKESDEDAPQDMSGALKTKLVVVGDGAVGKTSLLISYSTGQFPNDYVPTVFENYTATVKREHDTALLRLWDTAGQEDYDRLRPLSYPGTDIVCLCFSLCNRTSFESIEEKWHPEVVHYLQSAPCFLVGTKKDLRDSKTADPNSSNPDSYESVSTEEGQKMAEKLECVRYMEVSAKSRDGLEEVFLAAIDQVHGESKPGEEEEEKPKPKKKKSVAKAKKEGDTAPEPEEPKKKGGGKCMIC